MSLIWWASRRTLSREVEMVRMTTSTSRKMSTKRIRWMSFRGCMVRGRREREGRGVKEGREEGKWEEGGGEGGERREGR